MFEHSPELAEIASALSKAQGALESASKSSIGDKYKYADLAECLRTARAPLSENGLSISQHLITEEGDRRALVTMLMHSSGQWIKSVFHLETAILYGGAGKNPVQVLGSAITYQRRYAICSILGLAQEDNDASDNVIRQERSAPIRNSAPVRKPAFSIAEAEDKIWSCETEEELKLLVDDLKTLSAQDRKKARSIFDDKKKELLSVEDKKDCKPSQPDM